MVINMNFLAYGQIGSVDFNRRDEDKNNRLIGRKL